MVIRITFKQFLCHFAESTRLLGFIDYFAQIFTKHNWQDNEQQGERDGLIIMLIIATNKSPQNGSTNRWILYIGYFTVKLFRYRLSPPLIAEYNSDAIQLWGEILAHWKGNTDIQRQKTKELRNLADAWAILH